MVPEIMKYCIEVRGDHHGATKRKKSVPGHKPCATSLQAVLNTLSNTSTCHETRKQLDGATPMLPHAAAKGRVKRLILISSNLMAHRDPKRGATMVREHTSVLSGDLSVLMNNTDNIFFTAGFTLQEEARNTERHHPFWDTDQRLRHTKVNFVSAGSLEPTIPKDTESAMAEMTLDSPQNNEENAELDVEDDEETKTHTWTPQLQPKSPKQAWTFSDSFPNAQADLVLQGERSKASNQDRAVSSRPQLLSSLVESSTQDPTYAGFFVDTHGTTPVNTGLSPPRLRSTSPTPSNSSEEVILFGGRDRQGRGLSRAPKRSRATTDPIDAKIRIVEDKIHGNEELLEHVLRIDDRATTKDPKDSSTEFGSSNLRSHCGRHNHKTREEEEAALIADYIANIDSDIGGTFKSFNQRELGGAEDEIWQETEESSGDPVKSIDRPFQAGWSRASICDFDDLSTSDGVMGDVQAIISKRDRETGVQYLVVWENQTVDEARWVPVTTLISVNALLLIEKFEAEQKLVAEFLDSDEEDTSDSDVIGILGESDDEDVEEEEDLIQRKISHMSNEKIARLLAKQEELGMGSAEITLFDGDAIEDEDEIQLSKHTFSPVMLPFRKTRAKGWSAKRPRGEFPAAGLLADAYDGFDVMDFDRPSLKRKPKGRKGKLGFDLSDSEPEASMQMAWDNDRIKKKERRQEREGLRAQGLLGSKNSKLDLKQKYREGMGIDAVKEEIKSFLMGNNTT
jgi:hypothetical protein